jgi:hypothetical protein
MSCPNPSCSVGRQAAFGKNASRNEYTVLCRIDTLWARQPTFNVVK